MSVPPRPNATAAVVGTAGARPIVLVPEHVGVLEPRNRLAAVAGLVRDGCISFANAYPLPLIEALRKELMRRHGDETATRENPAYYRVGDNRYLISVDIRGVLNDPQVYANPAIMAVIGDVLSKRCVIESFGAVIAYPGAREQHVHRDHQGLFTPAPPDLPAYAITLAVPLVDLDETVGGTRVWPGSHRSPDPAESVAASDTGRDMNLARGGAYLMDYRLVHRGLANLDEVARPLLYITFSAPWFVDDANVCNQPKVNMSSSEFAKVPTEFRHLFARVFPRGVHAMT